MLKTKKNFLRRWGAMVTAMILSLSCLSLPAMASSGGDTGDIGDLAQRAAGVATAPTYDIWQVFTGEIDQEFLETTGETQLTGLCYGANAKSSADFMGRGEIPVITPGQPLTNDDLNVAQAMYYIMSIDALNDSDGAFLLTNLFVDMDSTPFKSGLTLEQVNAATVPVGWYVITSCTMGTTGAEGTVAKCFGNYEITTSGKAIGSFMTSDGKLNYVPKAGNVSLEKDIVGIGADVEFIDNGEISETNPVKKAFVAVGDRITFRLTATLPDNIASYRGFMLDFVDFLPYGFLLDQDSITVKFPDLSDEAVPVLANDGVFNGSLDNGATKLGYAAAGFKLPASENRAYYEDGLEVTVSRVLNPAALGIGYNEMWPNAIDTVIRQMYMLNASDDGVEPIDSESGVAIASPDELSDLIAQVAQYTPSLGRTCVVEYSGVLGDPTLFASDAASDYTLPIFSAANENVAQVLWSADPYEMQTWTGGTYFIPASIEDVTRPTMMWSVGYDVVRPESIACSVDASADVRTAGLTVHAENAAGEAMPVSYKLERIDYEGLDFWAYTDWFSCLASDFSDGMTYYEDHDGSVSSIRPDAGDDLEQWSNRAAYDGRYAYVWSKTPDGGPVAGWEYKSELAPATYDGVGLFSSTQEGTDAPQILGLGPGKYRLTPNVGSVNPGYNDLPIVEFELAMHPETGEIYVVGSELGDGSPADFINTAVSADSWVYINYVMTSGVMLPVTGGSGTVAILVAGLFLIACGGAVYFTIQKRRRAA